MRLSIRSSSMLSLIPKRRIHSRDIPNRLIRNSSNTRQYIRSNNSRRVSGIRDAGILMRRNNARLLEPTSHAIP